jgi:8-oxo-dGTP pyrophosphatase MutT (NUDIX family)
MSQGASDAMPQLPAGVAAAVTGTHADTQAAVPHHRLQADTVRAVFVSPPVWEPELLNDRILIKAREPAAAAVLIPLVMREDGLHVLLTQRTAHLRDHAGQISFPGGRCEAFDNGPVHTALRETIEEIGLHERHIEIIGQLPVYTTATNFQVTPVVGLVQTPFELKPDTFEVAEVFEVPLSFLMDGSKHLRNSFVTEHGERYFYSMPWRNAQGKEYYIWGATAAMLRNLYRLLSA